ncbi:MAG: 2TM domain-containing protein [Polyangiales bacterium]
MDERERSKIEREVASKALRRVRAKIGFRWHFAAFAVINVLLFVINMMFTPGLPWFVWPLGGWSIALAFHAFAVFQGSGASDDMLEAEIRREMERRGLNR